MTHEARSLFQNALKEALNEYHTDWRSDDSTYGRHRELDVYPETLIAWVETDQHPQARAFKAFLEASKFPAEVRADLLYLYRQLPPRIRKKRQNLSAGIADFDDSSRMVSENCNDQDVEAFSSSSAEYSDKRKGANPRFAILIACMIIILISISVKFGVQLVRVQTVGLCSMNAAGFSTLSNPREVYWDSQANLQNFYEHPFYVYFNGEYVSGSDLSLEGFDATKNQWASAINKVWIDKHPNWNMAALWKLDYQC